MSNAVEGHLEAVSQDGDVHGGPSHQHAALQCGENRRSQPLRIFVPVKVTAILHPCQPVGKQHLPLSERCGKSRLIRRIVLEFGGHAAQRASERASGDS